MFDVHPIKGLTDILENNLPPEQVIHTNITELGFDFLTCGAPSHHPTELLGSEALRIFLERMRKIYDVILIDSPPFLPVADVNVLSEFVDGLILVTRYQRTEKRHLKDVKRRFAALADKVFGVVINQVSVKEKDYYYHQYYYYGYGDMPRKK